MDEQPVLSVDEKAPMVSGRGFWIASLLTLAVLGISFVYLWVKATLPTPAVSEQSSAAASGSILALLLNERVADIGQFVSGLAGAIAFIWIVAAYLQQSSQLRMQRQELMMQRRELELQRGETKRLADEANAQVAVLKQTSTTARADAFTRMLELYERRLAAEASEISRISITDPILRENHENAWKAYERGDKDALIRNVMQQLARGAHKEFLQQVDRIAFGRNYLKRFCATARQAQAEAAAVDEKMEAFCKTASWAVLAETLDRILANDSLILEAN